MQRQTVKSACSKGNTMSDHRHTPPGVHEYDDEPQVGLPETLPKGEQLIWQGSPDWRSMAINVFHVRKVAAYLTAMMFIRGIAVGSDGTALQGLIAALWCLPLVVIAVGVMTLLAYLSARDTMYSVTDKRVIMRIGIALTLSYNIPLKLVQAAGIHVRKDGTGDIPLNLAKGNKIAFLFLWPHAKPWKLSQPEPMLRCLPNVTEVAAKLSAAWASANQQAAVPTVDAFSPAHMPALPELSAQRLAI
jgi:Bacterial PH domain